MVVRTSDLPVAERFEAWREQLSRLVAPIEATADDPAGFQGEIGLMDLGAVRVCSVTASPHERRRTPRMIGRSDPDALVLKLTVRGVSEVTQGRRTAVLRTGDLLLSLTSQPSQVRCTAEETGSHEIDVVLGSALLPIPRQAVESLTVMALSGREGVGALLADFLTRLVIDTGRYRTRDLFRLSNILIDLVTAVVTYELDTKTAAEPDTYQRTLLLRIQAFIQERLEHPKLSPEMIAAAHSISIRSLYRLFQQQGTTVARWIRAQRLDRCRRDLADPSFRILPIRVIAARWGFADPAHFTRAFSAAYGLNPKDYRHRHRGPARV